jgi:hypothetical protein
MGFTAPGVKHCRWFYENVAALKTMMAVLHASEKPVF